MDLIPIPYFGMIMSLFVVPALTFSFIFLIRKQKADVEKLKYRKEILELEIKKEETHFKLIQEENKKYDRLIEHPSIADHQQLQKHAAEKTDLTKI